METMDSNRKKRLAAFITSNIKYKNHEISELAKKTWGKKYFGYGHNFQIENFIDSVLENKVPIVNIKDGGKAVCAVSAIYKSLKTLKFEIVDYKILDY